jgi:hypothetical protein
MKKIIFFTSTYILGLTIVILFSAFADPVYHWYDKDGNEQYSNTPPEKRQNIHQNFQIIKDAQSISKNSEFVKSTKRIDSLLSITDNEWYDKFKFYDKMPPELPIDDHNALLHVKKIIADEIVYVELQKRKHLTYIDEYKKRENEYQNELNEAQASDKNFNIHQWKSQTIIESHEEYENRINRYLTEIDFHELVLNWAQAQKMRLEDTIQNKVPNAETNK